MKHEKKQSPYQLVYMSVNFDHHQTVGEDGHIQAAHGHGHGRYGRYFTETNLI